MEMNMTELESHSRLSDLDLQQEGDLNNLKCMTELHNACKEGDLQKVKEVLSPVQTISLDATDSPQPVHDLNKRNKPYQNTPLHLAVLFEHEDIVTYLEQEDIAQFRQLLSTKNAVNDTPVHLAARNGNLKMLKLMHKADSECIAYEGRLKQRPVHYAAGFGHIEAVKFLLSKDKMLLESQTIPLNIDPFERTTECPTSVETKQLLVIHEKAIRKQANRTADQECDKQWTPLTYACHFGSDKVVHYLLSVGAKPHPIALQKAIEGGYEKCAKLLLLVDDPTRDYYWRDILKLPYTKCTPGGKILSTTPFHELIQHMPTVAEIVLHNCTKMDRYFVNKEDFTVECSYDFVSNESAVNQHDPGNNSNSTRLKDLEHPIMLMVKHKRKELLTHPVVACYIFDKWRRFGWWWSLINLVIYVIFQVVLFTALIFNMPHPLDNNANCNCSKDSVNEEINRTSNTNTSTENESCAINSGPILGLAIPLLLHALFRVGIELGQLCHSAVNAIHKTTIAKDQHCWQCLVRVDYFSNWMNWIEFPLYTLTLLFIATLLHACRNNRLCLHEWEWKVGAFVMLFTWFELIVLFSHFQFVGVYALMFVRVLKTFLKVVILAILLIVAFTLTFYMLLSQPGYDNSPFMNAGRSILKVMAMSTGELNSDSFFRYGDGSDITGLPFPDATVVLWIMFFVLMSILLTNMLVGLAVGDITAVYKEAQFEKLSIEVRYIQDIEKQLQLLLRCCNHCGKKQPETCLCCCKCGQNKSKIMKPNAQKSLWVIIFERFISAMWGVQQYDNQEGIGRVIRYYSQKNKPRSNIELSELEEPECGDHKHIGADQEDTKVECEDDEELQQDTPIPSERFGCSLM